MNKQTFCFLAILEVEVTPPPRQKKEEEELRTGSPPDRKIVTPFAKLQLAAWKRAEAAAKGASWTQNRIIFSKP